ncbi:U3 small nucleolar ribonucleoprotein protein MPP10 [Battus philenor]|uniref:U3 small nucleolar ribonucleoprotein protein MPP10 n=1 Tax=Battus philenor TaxID=42288 RepID=UPI0035CFAFC2
MGTIEMEEVIDKFNLLTEKPAKYLAVQDEIKSDVKNLIKTLYDITKAEEEVVKGNNDVLPYLLVEDFDEEQIWQQVELQNSQCWDRLVWEVANCISNKNDLTFSVKIAEEDHKSVKDDEDGEEDEDLHQEDLNEQEIQKSSIKSKTVKQTQGSKISKKKTSIVDDDFFKLKDMEKFLINEEKNEGKKIDSDEESIDMFDDIDDEGSEDDEGNEKDMKYSDFFDGEENDEEPKDKEETIDEEEPIDDEEFNDEQSENELTSKPKKGDKKVRFAEESSEESESDNDKSETENHNIMNNLQQKSDEKKSEFEKRQQRLQQQISKLEEKTLKEAPWQLKGEVDASKRPQNSLLQEVVDFDLTSRPPPIITEQTTVTLEDLIKRRVKDKAWDDVVRKEKPVDDQLKFRKPEVLDHSKSKLSLAQVYEAEYLKQKQALSGEVVEEEEPEEHKELRESMEKLFSQLDALCHYHYTPKPPQAEVKIVGNTPAISMEEVAPVATSDAALLAPEEVKKKRKGDLLSKDERTQTDKKRERRKKKKLQRLKGKVTKVTEQRNTKKGVEANVKSIKTSKAFFQQLNEDSSSLLKLKTKRKNKGQ